MKWINEPGIIPDIEPTDYCIFRACNEKDTGGPCLFNVCIQNFCIIVFA